MFFQNGSKYIAEDIEYICKLMSKTLQMPIYFLDNNYDIFYSQAYGYVDNPMNPDKKELFYQMFKSETYYSYPVIKSSKYHENYFAVSLNMEDIFIGTFVAGPSTYSYITAETIDALISDCGIPLGYKRDLIDYFNRLPVIDYNRLASAGLMLFYSIYNRKLDLIEVIEKNRSSKASSTDVKSEFESNISKNRQNTIFHHSQNHEKITMQCIREGNKEKLLQHMEQPLDGNYGILSKNSPLRSSKNLLICGVALATRAAIEGGLNSELAFTLSDSYIQAIEEIDDIRDLADLNRKFLCDFADRVYAAREACYSKAVVACQNYIFKYLYTDISLKEVAEAVGLNPNYLSELFKKEVSITISEYIQKSRIEEAKRLLSSSNYSIMDISTWLNFHDQSHFTRLFKKFTGMTPKKYRNQVSVF